MSKEGFLYVATGQQYVDEAVRSAAKTKQFAGDRPIFICTNSYVFSGSSIFDKILLHPEPTFTYRDKISPLLKLPFKRTLFLDTDAYLVEPIDDAFDMLKVVDFLGIHAPVRSFLYNDNRIPDVFSEINSGVIGLRRSWMQKKLVYSWLLKYDQLNILPDQPSLRCALWWGLSKGLKVWVAPPEYNLRTPKPWLVGEGMKVKILHGRTDGINHSELIDYLNKTPYRFRCSSEFNTKQNSSILPYSSGVPKRIFILGSGRSGTSLVTSLFTDCGLYMGQNSYLKRGSNPDGFYEDSNINTINEDILRPYVQDKYCDGQRWLAVLNTDSHLSVTPKIRREIRILMARGECCLKDPRFSYTIQNWLEEIHPEEHSGVFCIVVFRNPLEFLMSVRKEIKEAPYLNGLNLDDEELLEAWYSQYDNILRIHKESSNWIFIDYYDIIHNKAHLILEKYTGLQVRGNNINPLYYRNRALDAKPPKKYQDMYNILKRQSKNTVLHSTQ